MTKIDKTAIRKWIESLQKRTTRGGTLWKSKSVWNEYKELRALLNLAHKRGWIKIVPAINITPQYGRRKPV